MKKTAFCAAMAFVAATVLSLATGCISVTSKEYLGLPTYAATEPTSVEILRTAPLRPHERLGEITLEPMANPSAARIEQKFQKAGAKMGANAVVIVEDRTMSMGVLATGPWYNRQVSPDLQRVIVGVAIRYTSQ